MRVLTRSLADTISNRIFAAARILIAEPFSAAAVEISHRIFAEIFVVERKRVRDFLGRGFALFDRIRIDRREDVHDRVGDRCAVGGVHRSHAADISAKTEDRSSATEYRFEVRLRITGILIGDYDVVRGELLLHALEHALPAPSPVWI